jgi:hypothetical protein
MFGLLTNHEGWVEETQLLQQAIGQVNSVLKPWTKHSSNDQLVYMPSWVESDSKIEAVWESEFSDQLTATKTKQNKTQKHCVLHKVQIQFNQFGKGHIRASTLFSTCHSCLSSIIYLARSIFVNIIDLQFTNNFLKYTILFFCFVFSRVRKAFVCCDDSILNVKTRWGDMCAGCILLSHSSL